MKIAWVSYDFEEYSTLHINELCKRHDVLMVMPRCEAGVVPQVIDGRVRQCRFEKPRLRQPLRQLASVRNLVAAIDRFEPDVIHYQQGHLWFNAALKKLRRYPLVMTIHDPRHHAGDVVSKKTPQWVLDYGFRQADHVIVHGELLARQTQELFGFRPTQTHVIPHVAMGNTDAASDRVAEPGTVLFFGRIYDYKGLRTLIAAEPLIAQKVADFRIVIAGTGDDFDQYATEMVHPERFEVHNRWISDDERADFFQRASVVVLPYNEATQSGVVPVAFNHARPVVATRVGALVECVDHERTGLLVPPRDPVALAGAIIRLINHPREAIEMGRAGKQMVDQQWSPEVVAGQTAAVYETAIAGRRSRIHEMQLAMGDR